MRWIIASGSRSGGGQRRVNHPDDVPGAVHQVVPRDPDDAPTGEHRGVVALAIAGEVADAAVPAPAVDFDDQPGVRIGEVDPLVARDQPWRGELKDGPRHTPR